MKFNAVLMLLATVLGISCGQILFKLGAKGWGEAGGIFKVLTSFPIIAGLLIYGISTVVWLYLLSNIELSKAYPFFALSFVIVPLLSWALFGETLDKLYFAGMICIVAGVFLTTR